MEDPSPQTIADRPDKTQLCDDIGRAVSSLWQRRSGARPTSVTTEYRGDVVRCTIYPDEPAASEAASEAEAEPATLGTRGYEQEAQAAVRRLTGRTVRAFVAKTESPPAVTNAFILERIRVRY